MRHVDNYVHNCRRLGVRFRCTLGLPLALPLCLFVTFSYHLPAAWSMQDV